MTDKPSREQLDKEVEQLRKDLKKLGEEIEMKIEMLGKRSNNMTPDDVKALLIKEPFILSPPLTRYRLREHGPIILDIIEEALYRQ